RKLEPRRRAPALAAPLPGERRELFVIERFDAALLHDLAPLVARREAERAARNRFEHVRVRDPLFDPRLRGEERPDVGGAPPERLAHDDRKPRAPLVRIYVLVERRVKRTERRLPP